MLTLILGGARSGKSSHAETRAAELGDRVLYVATAQAFDDDMAARIKKHREERPRHWPTLEAPTNVGVQIAQFSEEVDVVLIDCLTLLTSNVFLANEDNGATETAVFKEVADLIEVYQASKTNWIIVSNEVGMGIVPAYDLGRQYRDLLGKVNQKLAQKADKVIFMVAGLPMQVK
ncbi:MAG: bifunctional adenosylcobinamide kinase/adenosylcobinamide-phosphate guanylyltransferase [Chloroflexota bacterium]